MEQQICVSASIFCIVRNNFSYPKGSTTKPESCVLCDWIFWIFIQIFLFYVSQILVTLCKKTRKSQGSLGNQHSSNPWILEWIYKDSESHNRTPFLHVADPLPYPPTTSGSYSRQADKILVFFKFLIFCTCYTIWAFILFNTYYFNITTVLELHFSRLLSSKACFKVWFEVRNIRSPFLLSISTIRY